MSECDWNFWSGVLLTLFTVGLFRAGKKQHEAWERKDRERALAQSKGEAE